MRISQYAARLLANDIGLRDLTADELEQFRVGLEVEAAPRGRHGNMNTIAKRVADNLDADPGYYEKLDYWTAYATDVDLEDL